MGILGTAVKVGVASAVHGRVQRRQQLRWAEQDQRAAAEAAASAPPTVDSRLDQLRQLGELRDSGVLTEAEFEAQKAVILAS